ncbi:MAG TPA: NAD(P)-dependent oxidoreductase [Beijerinckiaceae bacterium]|nr:NAD(P)-dependent oxidoreductase [Beijerinckiaceae bacterium]
MSKPRIGFIGVGKMGHGMAKNLVAKGFATTVLGNRNRVPVDDLVAKGAAEGRDPGDVAARSDIVILCVTASPQVEQIVYGADGLLAASRSGLIVVDCSTSEPDSTKKIHADFAAQGVPFVDAPLARTPKEAEEGRLNVMVGAEPEVFAAIEPVLRAFAENIFHVGGPGAGHMFKLINNFFAMGQAALIAEAVVAASKAGLEIETLFKIVSVGAPNSGIFQMLVSSVLAGTYDGLQFGLDLARKDVRYYTRLTESLGVPSMLGATVHQAFIQASALGYGSELVPSLIKAQAQLAGTSLPHKAS